MTVQPLAKVTSLKLKLGLLVAVSVVVASVIAAMGRSAGVAGWLSVPVTIALALAVTQLLAVGMIAPLRQMTGAAQRMATGDYAVRVGDRSRDEVGELARAFNTMARDLAAVDRQRRELVANVSHELRTPLTALCGVLENLVDGVAPRDPDTLATALAQAERMAGLVDDLLDLARVDAGRAPLSPRPVNVATLLTTAVTEARMLGREVDFDVRIDPPDLVAHADPARLAQLVTNLLDNASRHSPSGGRVAVTGVRRDDRFELEVHDEGPGVAADDRERVFEPFGTLGEAAGGGGTGLGLAIARWVTDLHGGDIRFLEPRPPDRGARVHVSLPLEPPDRPATIPAPPGAAPAPPPAASPAATAGAATAHPPVSPGATVDIQARPLLDDLFGGYWPDRGVSARPGLLLGAVAVGVLAGLVLVDRDLGLGTFVVLLAAGAVVLAASPRRRDPFTVTSAALCTALAAVSTVRDAEWIAVLCILAGAALCISGAVGARTLSGFVLAGLSWPVAGLRGLSWLGRTLASLTGLGRGAALLRTAVWSASGLLLFGALFASADALVAEWVDTVLPDLRVDTLVARAFLALAVAGVVLAASYLALNTPRVDRDRVSAGSVDHRFEWLVPVGVVIGVFAAFLVAQAAVVFGGHDYLQRTTGLTYADYVHQGFGQLTVATALTLLVIWAAARKAPRSTAADRLWLRASLGVLCLQTLVVVASALYRMHVYQEAYGFTRLRLLVDVFEGWLGLLVIAVLVSGAALRAAWLPRFALLSGCVALLGVAVVNPDAWVAEHNLDRFARTGKVDWGYLQDLSDDAVPVFARQEPEVQRCTLLDRAPADDDWLEWNLGRVRAGSALDGGPTPTAAPCPDDATS